LVGSISRIFTQSVTEIFSVSTRILRKSPVSDFPGGQTKYRANSAGLNLSKRSNVFEVDVCADADEALVELDEIFVFAFAGDAGVVAADVSFAFAGDEGGAALMRGVLLGDDIVVTPVKKISLRGDSQPQVWTSASGLF
jgi:hypothetical protein